MPRLVSLTLLSVLVLPAAALVYTLSVVLGSELLDYEAEFAVWLGADALTFGLVVVWWMLLWGRAIEWTAWMASATMLATGASVLLGIVAGIAVTWVIDYGEIFGLFIGGGTSVVAWLVSVCILWRRGAGSAVAADAGSAGGRAMVLCPKCGYALNGLREARCPECGEIYTLDALLTAQPSFGGGDLTSGS